MASTSPTLAANQMWPIYLLCNYDNTGSLLELYRSIFPPPNSTTANINRKSKGKQHKGNNNNRNQYKQNYDRINKYQHKEQVLNDEDEENNLKDNNNNNNNKHQLITSDYLTAEETQHSVEAGKGGGCKVKGAKDQSSKHVAAANAKTSYNRQSKKDAGRSEGSGRQKETTTDTDAAAAGLCWWQLIEMPDENLPSSSHVDLYRVQVLHLCANLYSKVSSFLTAPDSPANLTPPLPPPSASTAAPNHHHLMRRRPPSPPIHGNGTDNLSSTSNDDFDGGDLSAHESGAAAWHGLVSGLRYQHQQQQHQVQKRTLTGLNAESPALLGADNNNKHKQPAKEVLLSPTNLRRMSWRRKAAPPSSSSAFVQKKQQHQQQVGVDLPPAQRHLVLGQGTKNGTFSLEKNELSSSCSSIRQLHEEDALQLTKEEMIVGENLEANNENVKNTLVPEGKFKGLDYTKTTRSGGSTTVLERWLLESPEHSRLLPFDDIQRGARWAECKEKRGKFGESLVHILIVNQTNIHLIILIILIQLWPKLVSDIFESQKFKGLNLLHLSIAYSNKRLLKFLIETAKRYACRRQVVEQTITGSLFRSPVHLNPSSSQQALENNGSREMAGRVASKKQLRDQKQKSNSRWWRRWLSSMGGSGGRPNKIHDHCLIISGDNSTSTSQSSSSASPSSNKEEKENYWCDMMDHWPTANGHAHLLLFDRIVARRALELNSDSAEQTTATATVAAPASAGGGGGEQLEAGASASCLPIYLGTRPLSWSVSFNKRSMYEMLVELGEANQNGQDREGNSCLHQVVINDQLGWTRFLVKSGASDSLRNSAQLTPLLLSCHLGRVKLFEELLELSAVEFWAYSMVRCCGYPLTSLDSLLAFTNTNSTSSKVGVSAMSVILESKVSNNEQKAQLLSSAVVKKLLEEKWRIFARRLFYNELLLALVHLFLMTLAISLRPLASEDRFLQVDSNSSTTTGGWSSVAETNIEKMAKANSSGVVDLVTSQGVFDFGAGTHIDWRTLIWLERLSLLRYLSELATLLLSLRQLIAFIREWRPSANLSLQLTYNPLLANSLCANLLIVLCALVRLTSCALWNYNNLKKNNVEQHHLVLLALERTEEVMLILAAPLQWSALLFFVAAFRVTGPFVAMIRYMIVRDLRQFSLIYLVFLYSFAQCIFFVNHNHNPAASTTIKPIATMNQSSSSSQHQQAAGGGLVLSQLVFSYAELCMDLFKMTLGVYDLQPYRHSTLARLFFLLFLYLIPILFNMLIAMMNNTYSLIISQSERAWSFQWARTLFALERRLNERDKGHYLRLYSINMVAPSGGCGGEEVNEDQTTTKDSTKQNKGTNEDEIKNHSLSLGSIDDDDRKQEKESRSQTQVIGEAISEHTNVSSNKQRFVPALMIIKRMNNTRAERRRLVVGYWQKALRNILDSRLSDCIS